MGRAQHEGAAPYICFFQLFGNILLIISTLQHGSSSLLFFLSPFLFPSPCPSRLSLSRMDIGWLAGCWVRTGDLSVGNAEAFFKDGRGRLAQSATLLRLHVFFSFDRGETMGQGDCPTYSKWQFASPPTPKGIILLNLGCVQHRVIRYYWGGGGWTMKFNFACRSDLPRAARRATRQSALFTRSPHMATGCWHLPGTQVITTGQHHLLLQTLTVTQFIGKRLESAAMGLVTMMVCVRGWVFAGKVSPQLIQLAYKVPVSGSCGHQVRQYTSAACSSLKKRYREQMGCLTETTNF